MRDLTQSIPVCASCGVPWTIEQPTHERLCANVRYGWRWTMDRQRRDGDPPPEAFHAESTTPAEVFAAPADAKMPGDL